MGVAVLLASGAALGITNGTPDTTKPYKYPYVGALVDKFEDGTYPYCTGTLISPTVLVTAAHCYPETSETQQFGVTFEAVYDSNDPKDPNDPFTVPLQGTHWHEDPINDIAVVVFDNPPFGDPPKLPDGTEITLPKLPTYHQLNDLNLVKGDPFTAVGYGGYVYKDQGPWIDYKDQREWAVTKFNSLNRTYLRLSQKDTGGTCYGDSGGPNFRGRYDSDYDSYLATPLPAPTLASITITGDSWCQTTNVTLRLDTQSSRAFLDDYVDLP